MGWYELGFILVFAGMVHTLIKNKGWYEKTKETISGIVTDYGYPSWLMAAGVVVLCLEYFGVSLLFVVTDKTGGSAINWGAVAASATAGLLFLGWWVRRDFIQQSSFKLAMEVIQDILCRDVIMWPGRAQASIIKIDKLVKKIVTITGEENQTYDYSLIRRQLDLSINDYMSIIDELVLASNKCIFLETNKELKNRSILFEETVVRLMKVDAGFFYYMKNASDGMSNEEFCLFFASIANGQVLQDVEAKAHEIYLNIKRESDVGEVFVDLMNSINDLKAASKMFLADHR